jgi:glutamyl-tRNA reductase
VNQPPGSVLALVTHARHVRATDRERFATSLREGLDGRCLIFETCHRVEAYVGGHKINRRALALLPDGGRVLRDEAAVRHAMTVAVGRDSAVIGEDQVLHQLREAVDSARAPGGLDPILERLFAIALRAGRRARSWQQGPSMSLADVALASVERRRGPIRGDRILVVGAGRMGRLAARAGVASGASVAVANRSPARAQAVARSSGARVEDFDPGVRISEFAGVVVALAGPWPIGPGTIRALVESGGVVVDLSVPAAVPDDLASSLGERLISADALARETNDEPLQGGAVGRVEELVDSATTEFLAWLAGNDARAAAAALAERVNLLRETELAALWQRVADLDPETRDAIDAMTRHFAERVLREPLERLSHDRDGRAERAVREVFAL